MHHAPILRPASEGRVDGLLKGVASGGEQHLLAVRQDVHEAIRSPGDEANEVEVPVRDDDGVLNALLARQHVEALQVRPRYVRAELLPALHQANTADSVD